MKYLLKYNKPNIFVVEGVRLLPGNNVITKAQWEAMNKHPLLPLRFKNGDLEWVAGKSPESYEIAKDSVVAEEVGTQLVAESEVADKVENPLKACNAKQAKEIVAETYDVALLNAWLEDENSGEKKRESVVRAIEEQIKKLQPTEEEIAASEEDLKPSYGE